MCYRDAEKRAVAQAKLQKQEEELQRSSNLNKDDINSEEKDTEQSPLQTENPKKRTPKSSIGLINRPGSGSSANNLPLVPKYPASILHNRDPVYQLHRRERKRVRCIFNTFSFL